PGAPLPLTLAVHPGALGDVLLAVPALRFLKHRDPLEPLLLAAQPRIGELLAALGVVDRAIAFDALGLDRLFGSEPREPVPLLRDATRVVSWFGARDPDFVRRLTALVPDTVVVPSVGEARPVWEHLLASVGAPMEDTARWRGPVAPAPMLVDEGRRALRDAGWDGRTPAVVLFMRDALAWKSWAPRAQAVVVSTASLERVEVDRVLAAARRAVG